jgi:LysM repeat protein
LDTDYWSLTMPTETQNYVPRLLALARIFANPGGFGLKLRPLRNEPYFIKVHVDREADIGLIAEKELTTVAKLADYNQEEFVTLNAAYLSATLSGTKAFSLLMPIGNANSLHKSLAFMAQSNKLDKKQLPFYLEPVFAHNANRQAIKAPLVSIGLDDEMTARSGGSRLEHAKGNLAKPDSPESNPEKEYLVAHYLEHGETLKSVAEHHGLSEEALRAINKFNRKQIVSLGQRLLIPFKQLSPLSNIGRTMLIR